MVTDTSFLRNPHYHQPTDTVETLDLPFLAAVIEELDAALPGAVRSWFHYPCWSASSPAIHVQSAAMRVAKPGECFDFLHSLFD